MAECCDDPRCVNNAPSVTETEETPLHPRAELLDILRGLPTDRDKARAAVLIHRISAPAVDVAKLRALARQLRLADQDWAASELAALLPPEETKP